MEDWTWSEENREKGPKSEGFQEKIGPKAKKAGEKVQKGRDFWRKLDLKRRKQRKRSKKGIAEERG